MAAGQSATFTVRYQLGLLSPCTLVILNCTFATTVTMSMPDALDTPDPRPPERPRHRPRSAAAALEGMPPQPRFWAGILGVSARRPPSSCWRCCGDVGQSPARPPGPAHVPDPAARYQIDAVSGSHHASLLNLPVGQPGVFQAPIPVDVDGDLIPDVTVAVNLVNVNGAVLNPPKLGQVIAPNMQINRLLTAPLLGQNAPPLAHPGQADGQGRRRQQSRHGRVLRV